MRPASSEPFSAQMSALGSFEIALLFLTIARESSAPDDGRQGQKATGTARRRNRLDQNEFNLRLVECETATTGTASGENLKCRNAQQSFISSDLRRTNGSGEAIPECRNRSERARRGHRSEKEDAQHRTVICNANAFCGNPCCGEGNGSLPSHGIQCGRDTHFVFT
jgi:hypothetical protein